MSIPQIICLHALALFGFATVFQQGGAGAFLAGAGLLAAPIVIAARNLANRPRPPTDRASP